MADVGKELDAQPVELGQPLIRRGKLCRPCGNLLLEFCFGIEQPVALVLLMCGHFVEPPGERTKFVAAIKGDPVVEITTTDRLCAFGQKADRAHQ